MEFNKEIEKIIEYQNASLLIQEKKSETALKAVIDGVKNDYENGNYDFSRFTDIVIKQIGKDRYIKTYSPFSKNSQYSPATLSTRMVSLCPSIMVLAIYSPMPKPLLSLPRLSSVL